MFSRLLVKWCRFRFIIDTILQHFPPHSIHEKENDGGKDGTKMLLD